MQWLDRLTTLSLSKGSHVRMASTIRQPKADDRAGCPYLFRSSFRFKFVVGGDIPSSSAGCRMSFSGYSLSG